MKWCLIFIFCLCSVVHADTYSRNNTPAFNPVSGDKISSSAIKDEFDKVATVINGNIDGGNVTDASITDDDLSATGVTASTYNGLTISSKGRVTAATNIIIDSGTNIYPATATDNVTIGGTADNTGGDGNLNLIANTPPTSPPANGVTLYAHSSNDTNTKLLLNLNGADASTTITDSSTFIKSTSSIDGDAQLDTAEQKFGTASLLLDGTGDSVTYADSTDWDLVNSTSDSFTVSFFVKHTDHAGDEVYFSQFEDTSNRMFFRHEHGSGIKFNVTSSGTTVISISGVGEITDTNWHHVVLVKIDDEYAVYVDGSQVGYVQDTSTDSFSGNFIIGAMNSADYFDGHIDDFIVVESNLFSATPVVGLTDTITVPVAEQALPTNVELRVMDSSGNVTTLS